MTWTRASRLVPPLEPEPWVTRLRSIEPYGPDPIVFGVCPDCEGWWHGGGNCPPQEQATLSPT